MDQIISETMIKTIAKKINDQIEIYMDTYDAMRRYFDHDGWDTCVATMVSRKIECTCVTCGKLISVTVVCCSTCKNHYECQNATALDLKKRQ